MSAIALILYVFYALLLMAIMVFLMGAFVIGIFWMIHLLGMVKWMPPSD